MGVEDLLAQEHAQQAMGVPQGQAPQGGPPQGGPPEGQPQGGPAPQPKPSEAPTAEEIAQKATSPNTEDKKSMDNPVLFDVDMGEGNMEQFSPQQIKGMKERYTAMNRDHMEAKPIMDLFKAVRERAGDGDKAAKFLLQSIKKNAPMGEKRGDESHSEDRNDKREEGGKNKTSMGDQIKQWSEQNSVEVPPGYSDMMATNAKLAKQNEMLMGMMQDIRKQGMGVQKQAQGAQQQAQMQGQNAMQQQVTSNLEKAAQAAGVSEDQSEDFSAFLAQRGYNMSEMADPQLAATLMKDFASGGNSEELEAIKRVMQKRQAHSGSLGSTPQSGDAGGGQEDMPKHERLLRARGKM